MDELLFNALSKYYDVLGKLGYISYGTSEKLLILSFYRDFVFQDYRGLISRSDYLTIERALDCIWGSSCLIPYPDYLKMGKLHLGEITEIAQRLKTIEDTEVLKPIHDIENYTGPASDIIITVSDESSSS